MNKQILCVVLLLLVFHWPSHAQEENALEVGEIVEGVVGEGETAAWTFYGWKDNVLSFHVVGLDGFDPLLTIWTNPGELVIQNDDYYYPDSTDALVEAITLPRTGNYRVEVSGYGGVGGDFTLVMLPGYADLALSETFESFSGWEVANTITAEVEDGLLSLAAEGIQTFGWAYDPGAPLFRDYFAQMSVSNVSGRNGWNVGLVLRRQSNGDHYIAMVNSRGQWRFSVMEEETERVIRDWTPHPAILEGQTSFRFSVLANGRGFDVFYNDQIVGALSDDTISESGHVGLMVMTPNVSNSDTLVTVESLLITTPLINRDETIVPQNLVRGGGRSLTLLELERRRLIPAGGRLVLNVEESFIERAAPGVSVIGLGRGSTYESLAVGTTAVLQSGGEGVLGCGLILRRIDESAYTLAYIDTAGGHGVSIREGDTFVPGLFAENDAWSVRESSEMVIIVNDGLLHLYINGQHAGSMEIEPVAGEIGNAVVNFDPASASCRFTDTWVWSWD